MIDIFRFLKKTNGLGDNYNPKIARWVVKSCVRQCDALEIQIVFEFIYQVQYLFFYLSLIGKFAKWIESFAKS